MTCPQHTLVIIGPESESRLNLVLYFQPLCYTIAHFPKYNMCQDHRFLRMATCLSPAMSHYYEILAKLLEKY